MAVYENDVDINRLCYMHTKIHHSHILRLYDIVYHQDYTLLVYDLTSGSISDYIKRGYK